MTLSVEQLEKIVSLYSHATTEQEQQAYNKILTDWRNSRESNITSLEIIQGKSNYHSLILYSLYTLTEHMKKEVFSNEDCANIFNTCFIQVQNRQGMQPEEPVLRNLIILAAYATYYSHDPRLFNQFSILSPNVLIYYFDDLIQKEKYELAQQYSKNVIVAQNTQLIFSTNLELFFTTLSAAQVCSQTFVFMKTLMGFCKVSFLAQYLPLFEIGLREAKNASAILTFFEELISFDPVHSDDEDIAFQKKLILLLVDFAEKIIENTKLSSYIWNQVIDINFTFYGDQRVGIDFSHFVFVHFIKCLSVFIKEDIEEFYVLYSIYGSCIRYIPTGCEQLMMPFIEEFLQFIIFLVNSNLSFCNDEISMQLKQFSHRVSEFEFEEYEYENNEEEDQTLTNCLQEILSLFYRKNLDNLSQGFVYVFSYAPSNITKILASNIALKIISMQNPPPTTVYFVMNCCKHVRDSIDRLMQICLSFLPVINAKDFGKCLASYANYYPKNFADKLNTLLPIIVEIIKSSNSDVSKPYFIALFTLFHIFTENTADVQRLFSSIGAYFLGHLTFPIANLDVLRENIFYLDDVIRLINPEGNQLMMSFLNSLFEQILSLFAPFLSSVEPIVQEDLCMLFKSALHSNWVGDRKKILQWVQESLLQCPNADHFEVLIELADLLPTEKFQVFLAQTGELPVQIVRAEVSFLRDAFQKNRNLVLQLPIQLLLFFLTKGELLRDSLFLFRMIIASKDIMLGQNEVKSILETLFTSLFTICNGDDAGTALALIRVIAIKYANLNAICQQILNIIGPTKEKELQMFVNLFMSPPNKKIYKTDLSIAANVIIRIYKMNHPAQFAKA